MQTKTRPGQIAKQKEILKTQAYRNTIQPSAEEEVSDNLNYFNTHEIYRNDGDAESVLDHGDGQQQQYSNEIITSEQPAANDGSSYYYEGNNDEYLPTGDQSTAEYYDPNQFQYSNEQQPAQYVSAEPQTQYLEEHQMNMQPDQNYVVKIIKFKKNNIK